MVLPRTGREYVISLMCAFLIIMYLSIFYFLPSVPHPDADNIKIVPFYGVVFSVLIFLIVCCTCCHLFGYNQLIIKGLLNKIDEKNKTNISKCTKCGHENIITSQFCVNCGNLLKS